MSDENETLLGTVLDADTDPVEVYADADGTVTLRWEHGTDMVFGNVGRDKLRELLDRAAMLGQPGACAYCEDDPDHPDPDNPGTCTCASPGCGRGWCPQRDDFAATPGQPS